MHENRVFIRKKKLPEEMALQITSMADIFTIILVFLLKSYSSSAITVQPTSDLILPATQEADEAIEAIRIEVSEVAILVEAKVVSPLENFRFSRGDLETNGSSRALNKELDLQKKKQTLISQSNTDVKMDQKVLVVADRKTPYSTLKSVLASAATNGFTDFKLVVAKKE